MIRFHALLSAAVSIALTVSAPQAQNLVDAAPGTKVTGVATLGNKQVPLPEGEWELVFAETDRLWSDRTGPVGSANAFLVQNAGGKPSAYIVVRTNTEPYSNGLRRPRACDRDNLLHNDSDSHYNQHDADCWMINHIPFGRRKARRAFFNEVRKYVRKTAGTSTLLVNWYWRNDSSDFIRVAHYANPAAYGFPRERFQRWVESDWHVEVIGDSPRRKNFVEAAKIFGAKYREAVRAGFRNKLGGGVHGLKFEFSQ